jgi:uncharacterized membrane protein YsdA (DUF1294 family)
MSLVVLALFLVTPVYALTRLAVWVDWRLLIVVPPAISFLTFLAYRADKRRAELNEWRISERTLHLLELLGGWPGAFVAQRYFRHKTAKDSYQFVFWSIVIFHQLLALDSRTSWRYTKTLLANILN